MTPLKDRVQEDAARARLQRACVQASKLHALLLAAGIVDDPRQGETVYDRIGNARFRYEGIEFTVSHVNSYDHDAGEYGPLRDTLEANLLCTEEGCDRTLYYGIARDIHRLGDLQQILTHERGRCNRDHNQPIAEEDTLEDLPF